MLKAENLNQDENGWVKMTEFYDPTLYKVGIQYLTYGTMYEEDYNNLSAIQKNAVAWLKRVVGKIEKGTGTEVADE